MNCKTSLATLLFLGALPLAAMAADATPPGGSTPGASSTATGGDDAIPPMFKELDANKDGYVSRDEAKRSAEVTARFSEMDTDRDGRITVSEFRKGTQPKM
ncbi:EF-hand domain-containing protein [Dechloromonas sp. XY25]|uniref:EF-hand domain-containing protein n=1 Tax=Dechloromonas hankyongensis TaxID=2908002 RepID=A0ABS9K6A0_9RHOO|nr:EF-hand domain-containing protein [Dechloromonas hankyongensis]MCG2578697.1 EF-hand domain-containing protein [Dechloromonas hankyongensis]